MDNQAHPGSSGEEIDVGYVVQTLPEGIAHVAVPRREGCRSDAWAKNICDQFDRDKVTLRVLNPVQAAEGNLVEVRFQTPPVGKSMIVVYLLPILALILGAVLGAAWNPLNNQDLSAVAGAVIVFICCLGLILGINRKNLGDRGGNMPSITKILEDSQHQ